MKLVICISCAEIIVPVKDRWKMCCNCEGVGARYIDNGVMEVFGERWIPVGVDGLSFKLAWLNQPLAGQGELFKSFVIPKYCASVVVVKRPSNSCLQNDKVSVESDHEKLVVCEMHGPGRRSRG